VNVTFIASKRQQVWGWPAVLNFTVACSGAGLWLFQLAADNWLQGRILLGGTGWERWAGPFLLAAGMAPLAFEAGKPSRAWRAMTNLRHSWMSRESLAAAVFLAASVLGLTQSRSEWLWLAGLAAVAFIVSQGCIIWRCKAVPAWNTAPVVWFFVTSALLSGSAIGLLLAVWGGPAGEQVRIGGVLTLGWLLLDLGAWARYLQRQSGPALQDHISWLRGRTWLIVGIARIMPAAILLAWLVVGPAAGAWARGAAAFAASVALFGTALQKAGLLRHSGYLREISLPLTPKAAPQCTGVAR
jgi:DMSO reductase anchor subunit